MLRTNKGFTLVELMVVIVIMGVLAALAIPKFTDASAKAKISEAPTSMATFENAVLARQAETSDAPADWSELVIENMETNANYSKWYTYAATYTDDAGPSILEATPTAQMGDVLTTDVLGTEVSRANVIDHATHKPANYEKYLPNY